MLRTHMTRWDEGRALFLLLGMLCVLWMSAESSRAGAGTQSQAPAAPAVPATKGGGPADQVQQQTEGKSAQRPRAMSRQELDKLAAQRGPLELQLFAAVDRSDVKAVSACLDKGANVNAQDDMGRTPLHRAVYRDKEIAEVLIAKGADVNARDETGSTPLHWAVVDGRRAAAEVLIAKGADLDAVGIAHETPLLQAIRGNDLKMARLLVTSGANLPLRGEEGTPLRTAVNYSRVYRNAKMVDFLLEAGAPLDIYIAAALGRTDYLKAALAKDPSAVNRADESDYKQTALHLAAFHGQKEAVEFLLSHGADVNAKDRYDAIPLHEAVYSGHQEIVRILLERGADVNAFIGAGMGVHERVSNKPCDTPLHLAARRGDVAMVKILLEHGANVKARNSDGIEWFGMVPPRRGSGPTPLGVAVKGGHKEVADLLRQHGATR